MKRKSLSKVLSCVLAMSMTIGLIACGSESKESSVSTKETTGEVSSEVEKTSEVKETPTEEREHVELVWYTFASHLTSGMDATIDAVNEYLKEKLNTTLDIHFFTSAEYSETVSTILSSGTYIDLLCSGAQRVSFPTFAANGAFVALEDYVDEYLPGTKAQLPEASWEAYTVDGHLYAVPPVKDLGRRFSYRLNQTLADDLGITFPEKYSTYWDLVDWYYEVKEKRDAKFPDKVGQPFENKVTMMQGWYFYEPIVSTGEQVVANVPELESFVGMGSGETVFCPYYTEEYRELAKLQNRLVKDNIIPFDATSFDPDKVIWNAGEMLGDWNLGDIYIPEDQYMPYFKTTLYTADTTLMTKDSLQTGGFAIPAQSEHVERTLEVIELLNTDTYLTTLLRFGPENVGWTDNDNDGVVELTDLNADSSNRYWYYWNGWPLGNMTVSKTPPGVPATFGEMVRELNNGATAASNIAFAMDNTPVENEIAACANVISEYHNMLMTGQNDNVDELVDAFIAKLKANGMDKVVEEAQKQLTAWRAANGLATK